MVEILGVRGVDGDRERGISGHMVEIERGVSRERI